MKKAFVFPGQGTQYVGMGKDLYEDSGLAKEMFDTADTIVGFSLTDFMFQGSAEDLKQTKITQPAIFLHSVILANIAGRNITPDMVAGHSLGEFSALVANGVLDFESGIRLVLARANAMQKACEAEPSAMAAIIGLDDRVVEETCESIDEIVVPANYNSPGQLVISGSTAGIQKAIDLLKERGAKIARTLPVGGAFHSPLMETARKELASAIEATRFSKGICPIYQNVNGSAVDDPDAIRLNLISQLTAPVRWTETIGNMISDGSDCFIEVGPGKVLQGMIKRIRKDVQVMHAEDPVE